MKKKPKIAILGGGGRSGKFLLAKLFEQQYPLKLLLRDATLSISYEMLEIIQGDALDFYAVERLLTGCFAVISTIGQRKDEPLVAARATDNILQAMATHNIRRYIALAGLNIDTPFDKKGQQTLAATTWMKSTFPAIQKDRQKAYDILSRSDVDWSLVRVPMIEFAARKGNVKVSIEDCPGDSITAGDIADFLVTQLEDPQYVRQSPFIAN